MPLSPMNQPADKLVIGIDEAGYGPSMGPLVIAATIWRMPIDCSVEELTAFCSPEIQPKSWLKLADHIPIGDSKEIYKGKFGWESLTCGARWLIEATHKSSECRNWWELLPSLAPSDWDRFCKVPWYQRALGNPNSHEQDPVAYTTLAQQATSKLQTIGVQLLDTRVRLFDEPEYNRCVEMADNKATVLSESSLGLIKQLAIQYANAGDTLEILCDKHGGRSRYQPVLMHCFDNEWFHIELESQRLSRYRSAWNGTEMRIQFRVEGDALLPSAAASILAKWTREQTMNSLNRFWEETCKEAGYEGPWQDTAGYYVDAERFSKVIAPAAAQFGLARDQWWRSR